MKYKHINLFYTFGMIFTVAWFFPNVSNLFFIIGIMLGLIGLTLSVIQKLFIKNREEK